MPTRRAPSSSSFAPSPTNTASCGSTPSASQQSQVDPRVGLREPHCDEKISASKSPASSVSGQTTSTSSLQTVISPTLDAARAQLAQRLDDALLAARGSGGA